MAMWKCNGKRQKERKGRKYSLAYSSYTDSAVPSDKKQIPIWGAFLQFYFSIHINKRNQKTVQ